MGHEDVELVARLKLDTTDAKKQLESLSTNTGGPIEIALPKGQKIELPKEAKKSLKELFSGDKGIGNIATITRSALGGVSGLTRGLAQLVPKLTLISVAVGAITKLLRGTDTMREMVAATTLLTNTLRDVLSPVLSALGELFIDVTDIIALLLPLLEPIVTVLRMALVPIVAAVKILKPLIDVVLALNTASSGLLSIFTDTALAVVESLADGIVTVIEAGILPLLNLLQPVEDFFNQLQAAIQSFVTKASFGLINFDKSITTTSAVLTGGKSSLDTFETAGGMTATQRAARDAKEAAQAAAAAARDTFKASGSLGGVFVGLKDSFVTAAFDAWKEIVNIAKNAWISIGKLAANIWGGTLAAVDTATEAMSEAATNVWEGTKELAATVGTKIKDKAKGAWSWVKGLTKMDDGGTLGAQVWGMNEVGNPEFLFNAGGHDTVINAAILEEAMYAAMSKALSQRTQELKVSIKAGTPAGPRELVQWILPSLKFSL